MKGQLQLTILLGITFLAQTEALFCDPRGQKVWVIQAGDNYGTFDTIDENGIRTGYGEAIVLEACKAANIMCKIVYAPYRLCLESPDPFTKHINLGEGLEKRYFDACSGYYPTYEREDVALFSDGFLAEATYHLLYLRSAPRGFVGSLRVGFTKGPPGDELCMNRYLRRIGDGAIPNFTDYGSQYDAIEALRNNQIDLVWDTFRDAILSQHPEVPNLRIFDTDNNGDDSRDDRGNGDTCTLGPAGIVTRHDNEAFILAFNLGLKRTFYSDVLKEICQDPKWNIFRPTSEHKTWCIPV